MSTRDLTITYDGYSVPNITGKVRIDRDRERGHVEFDFVVQADTEAAFASAAQAAESAFQAPYGNLTVSQSGNTLFSGSQASRTFLDAMPSIAKGERVEDTGLSRRYTARVEFGLPADTGNEPYEGLREMFVDVFISPSRAQRVTITGTVTGVGSTGARATYDGLIDTIIADVASDLSLSDYDRTETPSVRSDTNDNIVEFVVVLQGLIFSQAGSSLDDPDIVSQELSVTRRVEAPGDTPQASRLITIELMYSATLDSEQTTDIEGKYLSIRSWLIKQMKAVLSEQTPSAGGSSGSILALTTEEHTVEPDRNQLLVRMVGVGTDTGNVISRRVTTSDRDLLGKVVLPVWSGRNTDAYVYQGPRVVNRTLTYEETRRGTHTEQDVIANAASFIGEARSRSPAEASGPSTNWVKMERNPSATQLRLGTGVDGSDTIDITESTLVYIWRWATTPAATSPRGGSPAPESGGGGEGGGEEGTAGDTGGDGANGDGTSGGGAPAPSLIDDDLGGDDQAPAPEEGLGPIGGDA